MTTKSSVTAVYSQMSDVESAIAVLQSKGVARESISVVAQGLHSDETIHGIVFEEHPALHSGASAAWVGGIFGLMIGLAIAWIPGIGPIVAAGPIAASIATALEGAALGASGLGLLGGLVSWGVSEGQMHEYEEMVRNGKYLLVVHGDEAGITQAEEILRGTEPELIDVHGLS